MKHLFFLVILSFMISSCASPAPTYNDPIPVHETFTISSSILGEDRVINVWIPNDSLTTMDTLPVIYMLDGGIKEDFPHIANTLAELIKAKSIPPYMLVGIENTQRRRDLSGPTTIDKDKEIAPVVGESAKFRSFVNDELFAEVQKRYKTAGPKAIIGESLAGLFVTETLMLTPDMFDYYIAFDPSLWWNDHGLVKTAAAQLAQLPSTSKRYWFAGSDAGDMSQYTKQLAETLKTANVPSLAWTYSDEPGEQHSTIFRATKNKALIWTLNVQ